MKGHVTMFLEIIFPLFKKKKKPQDIFKNAKLSLSG